METQLSNQPAPTNNHKSISFDIRFIVVILLVVIAAMLLIWKPWSNSVKAERTVQVSGEAKISATPDEYVFYPSYSFTNASKQVALAQLTKKSSVIVVKLKSLGVADSGIKTNANGSSYPVIYDQNTQDTSYTLSFTITVNSRELAQKVQDYLVTTSPEGTVSPQANFSDTKRKQLENQARDEATKDARAKAEQSARNLGFKIDKVKSVSDSTGFGILPLERGAISSDLAKGQSQLQVQPGENDLNYSVTVIYYIR